MADSRNWTIFWLSFPVAASVWVAVHVFRSERFDKVDEQVLAAKIIREISYSQKGNQARSLARKFTSDQAVTLDGYALDVEALLASGNRLLVVGPVGSGKTTFLEAVAFLCCLSLVGDRGKEEGRFPLLLDAKTLPVTGDFHRFLPEMAKERYGIPRRAFRNLASIGRMVIIVDGLDEAYNATGTMKHLRSWLDDYQRNTCIVAARSEEARWLSVILPDSNTLALDAGAMSREITSSASEGKSDEWSFPDSASKVLIYALLRSGECYELAEISGRTLLPPTVVLSVLQDLVSEGRVARIAKSNGRDEYKALPALREAADS
ncbi:NACHT domain-containing protein [Amycolatopsis sp. NPDC051045]|uniref:NACHT domain-containing protein n=1 Tax=Amycolatopsis sp. NPDC051045 TaxID=3156922 RepID=UPI0034448496